jgi:A/G-specific adenine glycosylase
MKSQRQGRAVTEARREVFRRNLLTWYDANKRDLPWRQNRDPYRVWLSEIMLQQTRVAAVVEYYSRFLTRFPTVEKLARAKEASVLAAWSGLGYYRRARMLHTAAKAIVQEHAGRFPESAAKLRALPGIGRYTAAAIASIAYGEPVAVVDGNLERMLGRVAGRHLSGEDVWQAAHTWLDPKRPGDFNQAMMELGALVCLPREPKCLMCPMVSLCATRGEMRKPEKEIRRRRETRYALDCRNGSVFLVQRPQSVSLMPGMWELPEITGEDGLHAPHLTLRHSITVTDYTVYVVRTAASGGAQGKWVARSRLQKLPLTGLTRKILRAAEVI